MKSPALAKMLWYWGRRMYRAFFGMIPKRPEPGGVECRGAYPDALYLTKREGDVEPGEWLVARVEFEVVGESAGTGGLAECRREEMSCRWTVLE
jgi:hypothetical protein